MERNREVETEAEREKDPQNHMCEDTENNPGEGEMHSESERGQEWAAEKQAGGSHVAFSVPPSGWDSHTASASLSIHAP